MSFFSFFIYIVFRAFFDGIRRIQTLSPICPSQKSGLNCFRYKPSTTIIAPQRYSLNNATCGISFFCCCLLSKNKKTASACSTGHLKRHLGRCISFPMALTCVR